MMTLTKAQVNHSKNNNDESFRLMARRLSGLYDVE